MLFRPDKMMSLGGFDVKDLSREELAELFNKYLKNGMHGLCASPYVEGQNPGDQLTEEQIRHRIEIIKPYTKWFRSFSCTEGNELIPKIAKEYGLKTMVGAWLGDDDEINKQEVANLIQLTKEGYVDIAAVGNEVMYRKDLTEDELLAFIYQVKEAIPGTPVGYVDAYYEFAARPRITEACDVILANCYPFWEGCHVDYSLPYMKNMYYQALAAGQGKKVIITETGWPSQGTPTHGAQPSDENFLRYLLTPTRKFSSPNKNGNCLSTDAPFE